MTVTVKAPGSVDPAPNPGGGNNGSNDGLLAMDDKYTMDAGKKLYFNTNHILLNDKAAEGVQKAAFALKADSNDGLTATVAAKSANGVTLEKWDNGTVVYKADTANGSDRIDYVLTDKYGNQDTGSVHITIKNGVAAPSNPKPPAENPDSPPQSGNGKGVVAGDDSYKVDSGKTLYFNTRHVTDNDKGNGALNVVSVDAVSDRGVKISWGAEGTDKDGTLVYKSQDGFKGVDKIDYKVVDKHGGYDIGTILIHVNDFS